MDIYKPSPVCSLLGKKFSDGSMSFMSKSLALETDFDFSKATGLKVFTSKS